MRIDTETRRQLAHIIAGSFFLLLLYWTGRSLTLLTAISLLFGGMLLSYSVQHGRFLPLTTLYTTHLERTQERHIPGKGALFFVSGVALTVFLFPDPIIGLAALGVLTFGDAASTLIGTRWGKTKIGRLSLEGTLGGMVIATLYLHLLLGNLLVALPVAVLAMAAEYLPIDDSFSIPLVAGGLLTILGSVGP